MLYRKGHVGLAKYYRFVDPDGQSVIHCGGAVLKGQVGGCSSVFNKQCALFDPHIYNYIDFFDRLVTNVTCCKAELKQDVTELRFSVNILTHEAELR